MTEELRENPLTRILEMGKIPVVRFSNKGFQNNDQQSFFDGSHCSRHCRLSDIQNTKAKEEFSKGVFAFMGGPVEAWGISNGHMRETCYIGYIDMDTRVFDPSTGNIVTAGEKWYKILNIYTIYAARNNKLPFYVTEQQEFLKEIIVNGNDVKVFTRIPCKDLMNQINFVGKGAANFFSDKAELFSRKNPDLDTFDIEHNKGYIRFWDEFFDNILIKENGNPGLFLKKITIVPNEVVETIERKYNLNRIKAEIGSNQLYIESKHYNRKWREERYDKGYLSFTTYEYYDIAIEDSEIKINYVTRTEKEGFDNNRHRDYGVWGGDSSKKPVRFYDMPKDLKDAVVETLYTVNRFMYGYGAITPFIEFYDYMVIIKIERYCIENGLNYYSNQTNSITWEENIGEKMYQMVYDPLNETPFLAIDKLDGKECAIENPSIYLNDFPSESKKLYEEKERLKIRLREARNENYDLFQKNSQLKWEIMNLKKELKELKGE